ncbi:MAG TPA: PucR family transcriptional regulator ligand-binding domain-containing protein [Streptosporangiaceae bacterium]|nr:PucR family transcriptional regulator ligand-binding domain-containing protein [Streptosporangiaceae bacterium]
MLPTVADVLELDVVRRGLPKVLTASERLDAPVRWVHVIELAEARHLLRGGELVLTTGIALPPDAPGLTRYVAGLAAAGVSAVAVELGSRYVRELPAALVAAAAVHRLPLIMLRRETEFIAVTEAVHAQILDARVAELRAAERLHQVFTDLAVAGAGPDEVVAQASALAGVPVILADLAHRVLACSPAGQETEPLLAGFAGRSRAVNVPGRCDYDKAAGWLVAKVGQSASTRPGTACWARLIFVFSAPPGPADFVLAERTATALALSRLVRAGQAAAEQDESLAAQGRLLAELAGPGYADPTDLEARIAAFGIPLTGHQLQTLVVDASTESSVAPVANALVVAASNMAVPALVGVLDEHRVGGLLVLAADADPDRLLAKLASSLRSICGVSVVIGAGPVVSSVAQARAALDEAMAAAGAQGSGGDAPFARLADLRLAGLIYQLRDDPALLAFAERELGPLLCHDATAGTDLVDVLTCFLRSGGKKAEAAHLAGLARPTLYERLRKIEQVLGRKLDTPESQLSLHFALLVHPMRRLPSPRFRST